MGLHWDVDLEVGFENAEQAKRFSEGLKYDEGDDTCVRFELDDDGEAFIEMGNINGEPSFDDKKIDLFGECGTRFVGTGNAEKFFRELRGIARRANAVIKSIRLTFLTQEDGGYFVFFDALPEPALEKHFAACLDEYLDYEGDAPTEKEKADACRRMHEDFDGCIWFLIVENSDAMEEYMERDEDGRDTLNAFGDELNTFAENAIRNYEFPWDEGVGMYLYAVKDGEEVWENG